MTPGARCQSAIELLDAIDGATAPADRIARGWFRRRRYAGGGDRAAIQALVYATLRRRRQLDWWIERNRGSGDNRARVLAALMLVEAWSADDVGRAFDGGQYRPAPLGTGEGKMVAALAGNSIDDPDQPALVATNAPEVLADALRDSLGDEIVPELSAFLDEATVDLRVNTLKGDRDTALAALAEDGLAANTTTLSPFGLRLPARLPITGGNAFKSGLVELQDEGSQIIALLVGAEPGYNVVDFCAGAGGKSLALAATMENRGRIVACDVDRARLDRAAPRLDRAGVTIVEPRLMDGADDPWVASEAGAFERVLIDAPCSQMGAWRRNPESRWRLTAADLLRLEALQSELLDAAASLVRVGGRLVYATCSLLRRENEDQVAAFLDRAGGGFRTVPAGDVWHETIGGVASAAGEFVHLTPRRHGTDGFFVAILERVR